MALGRVWDWVIECGGDMRPLILGGGGGRGGDMSTCERGAHAKKKENAENDILFFWFQILVEPLLNPHHAHHERILQGIIAK